MRLNPAHAGPEAGAAGNEVLAQRLAGDLGDGDEHVRFGARFGA